jgi:O-6-methylguanine DNA methyltransferase
MLYQITYQSPLGPLLIVASPNALCLIDFAQGKYLQKHLEDCQKAFGHLQPEANAFCLEAQAQLQAYFAGERQTFDLPLAFVGTDFQQQVWQSLLAIPYGQAISYAQQAQNIGNPKGVRAVANANSRNKLAIVVPCHRVLGKNGSLTGYASGVEHKAFLLDLEK